MILQMLVWGLLVCLGLLLGSTWTTQALQAKLRRQAEERRRINEEWSMLRTARQQRSRCRRCASRLPGRDEYYTGQPSRATKPHFSPTDT